MNLKYLLSILSSKAIGYYYVKKFTNNSSLTNAISTQNLFNIPIKKTSINEQQPFIEKADLMLNLNKDLQDQSQKFQRTIQRKFEIETLSKKLQDWYMLPYSDFVKELAKLKIKLTLSQESEWEDYFIPEAKKLLDIKNEINLTDTLIDAMVYELYGLSEDEIAIVEKS